MCIDGSLVICISLIAFGVGHFCGWIMGWGDRARSARREGSQAIKVESHE